jgi:prepilin-type N-terminal cleavage/methylation domain-containing protein
MMAKRAFTLIEVLVAASIMAMMAVISWIGMRAAMPQLSDREEVARAVQFIVLMRARAMEREELITLTSDGQTVTATDAAGSEIASFRPKRFTNSDLHGEHAYLLADGAAWSEGGPLTMTLLADDRSAVCSADGIYGPLTTVMQ